MSDTNTERNLSAPHEVVKQVLKWVTDPENHRKQTAQIEESVVALCPSIAQAMQAAASLAKTRKAGKNVLTACFYVRKEDAP